MPSIPEVPGPTVFDEKLLRIAAQGFAVALTVSLVLMPGVY